jgi:hypothetical protein
MIRKSGNRFPNEEIGLGAIIAGGVGTIGFQEIPKSTRMPILDVRTPGHYAAITHVPCLCVPCCSA